ARVHVPPRLVVLGEAALGLGRRSARAGHDRARRRGVAGGLDVAGVVDTVGADQRAGPAPVRELLTQQARILVVAAVEQRGGTAGQDLRDGGGEVGLLAVRGNLVGVHDRAAEHLLDRVGQARAVRGAVVDDDDLLGLQ